MDKKHEVLEFLRSVSIMSVAVNGINGPISTILLFAVDDDFTFYFATHSDSYKAKALKEDNRISMSIWEFDKMLVQCDGEVSEITDESEVDTALNKLANSVGNLKDFWPPVIQITGNGYSVYKIKSKWVRSLNLSDKSIRASDLPFTEIL